MSVGRDICKSLEIPIISSIDISKNIEPGSATSGSRSDTVPHRFLETCRSMGITNHQQLRYIQEHRDLFPETKRIMYQNE